ncbi:hypothetical protein APY04_3417 [Hyphomicrobium sulfonivorans]|uniref:Uncharacterized protein n=1 Tax=Hyphomicrobium sulfonivorans TaxID=121290 RepID=A0A120CT63_HYPSL|nr:hypothetical protein APY04_3417 [Hyphomicrobium sulfonivorans]
MNRISASVAGAEVAPDRASAIAVAEMTCAEKSAPAPVKSSRLSIVLYPRSG